MNLRSFSAVLLAAIIALPALAVQDDVKGKRKGNRGRQNAANQLIKSLEPVGLTEDQIAKVKELGKVAGAKMKKMQEAAGITPALIKKRAEVMKSMKDSDKKGKDRTAAVNKEAGVTDAQAAALVEVNKVRTKFKSEVIALLSDEQKEKLPEQLQRAANAGKKGKGKGKGKGRGKKKKSDDA